MRGRPKLYHEKRTSILVTIENSHLMRLEDIADNKNITRNELINTMLKNADSEEALALAEALSQLRAQVANLEKSNKDLFNTYRADISKAEARILTTNYDDLIEPDAIVTESFLKVKPTIDKGVATRSYEKGISKELPFETFDYWTEKILRNVKDVAITKGKAIRDEKKTKLMIRHLLVKNYAK